MTQLDMMARASPVARWVSAHRVFATGEAETAFPMLDACELDVALAACAEWDGRETWTAKGVER